MGLKPYLTVLYGYYVPGEIEDVWQTAESFIDLGFDAYGDEHAWSVGFGIEIYNEFGSGNSDFSESYFLNKLTSAKRKLVNLLEKHPKIQKMVADDDPRIIINLEIG